MSKAGRVQLASSLVFLATAGQASLAWAQGDAPDSTSAATADESAPAATPAPAAAPVAAAVPAEEKKADDDKFAMGIYFNPVMILFGYYGLELDFSPQHFYSINVSAEYYSRTVGLMGLDVKNTAFEADVGVQLFLTGQKPLHGAYIYPRIAYAKAKAEETYMGSTVGAEASLIGLGVTAGYQWNWQPFSLRLGGGVMDYMGSAKATGDTSAGSSVDLSMKGVLPLIDLSLGFVF